MPINIVDVVSNQAILPRPIYVYDAGMNAIGALRAIGMAEDGSLGLVLDGFYKKKERVEEYREWEQKAIRAMRGAMGVKEYIQFFLKEEMPEIFDVRPLNLSVEDPAMDMVMGIAGLQLQLVWDYDGHIRMFYRLSPSALQDVNAKLGAMTATARLLAERVKEATRLEYENRYLKQRVGELQYALVGLQRFVEEHVGARADVLVRMKMLEIEKEARFSTSEMAKFTEVMKQGTDLMYAGISEHLKGIAGAKKTMLEQEKEIMTQLNEIRDLILRHYDIPLTEKQILDIVKSVILERPDWIAEQLRRLRMAGVQAPTGEEMI
ncbi:MAG: hypothetical protein ACP5KE_06570 [Candidatus Methanodesulfokora sp.]